ncbi:MAG: ABC transporter ATP-binding protein [Syntrophomonadaceae bacterium]|nr:ABC transporter ATP-binding protein [Syntrophomonadaceae bacterium]
MIEIAYVSKRFADLEALRDVSLSVHKGSVYGLVGSNGAGKTTLLKLLAGIYWPDNGIVKIDETPVFENVAIKERTVFIPDHIYYFGNYTIADMARFYQQIYPLWNEERFSFLAQVFEIDVNRRVRTLSKGMQRQVAFWLAFAIMPDVMILDEPLDGLDPVMRQKVKNLIVQEVAQREMTVIISSHNLFEMEDICDYIGILHEGRMLIQRDLDDLKADVHKLQAAFANGMPAEFLATMEPLSYEQRGSIHILIMRGNHQEIMNRLQSFKPLIVDILPLTLEEIFIHEMGDKGYAIKNIIY